MYQYVDFPGGSQFVFGDNDLKVILNLVADLSQQMKIKIPKELTILGLSTLATTITKDDIARNEDLKHPKETIF